MALPSISRLLSQMRMHGVSSVTRRVCKRALERVEDALQLKELDFPLRVEDIADSGAICTTEQLAISPSQSVMRGAPLKIGWVCAPPKPGSGGHTTLFRMIAAMVAQGHLCTIFLYDKNSDVVEHHKQTIRQNWPWLTAELRSAADPTDFLDAVVASSWESAHVVSSRMSAVANKFYFAQDYEPYFYPKGALYTLAEDTYSLGFKNIALGYMVADSIQQETTASVYSTIPFGCDSQIYYLDQKIQTTSARNGIVFYAKKNADRRGYILAKRALEIFGKNNPGQAIHVYGDEVAGWSVPVISHGNMKPAELNALYNSTIGSLTLSFTNISLVAGELISAGNIPVINNAKSARLDMDNPHAVWATATPSHLAAALGRVVTFPDIERRAMNAAESQQISWQESQQILCKVIENACYVSDLQTKDNHRVPHA